MEQSISCRISFERSLQEAARIHDCCGCSSMAERQLPKLHTRVRFPSPAPAQHHGPSCRGRSRCASRMYSRHRCIPLTQSVLLPKRSSLTSADLQSAPIEGTAQGLQMRAWRSSVRRSAETERHNGTRDMPKLLLLISANTTKQIKLRKPETTVGRATTNDIVIRHERVSRLHAVLTLDGPFVTIKDLASSNGVYVND